MPPPAPDPQPRLLIAALVGVVLVVSVISSLGAPLIPAIADSLRVPLSSAQWSLTAALLAGAVAAPILGRLGDGRHRRTAMLAALAIVFCGGLLAYFAAALAPLIAGRALQGVGLGMLPIAVAAAREALPAARVAGVVGLLSVSAAAGVGAGYPISGLIASRLDVQAAFLFGSLAAAAAFLATLLVVPASRAPRAARLDLPGAAIGSVGLVALLLGIGQGESWGWESPAILGCFAAAVVVLSLWVRHQLVQPAPLIDLRQLRHRAVLGADLVAILLAVALYMFLTVVTAFVQAPGAVAGFGATPLTAGLCLVPFALLSFAASRLASAMMAHGATLAALLAGILAIAASGAFFALDHGALWHAFAMMAGLGVGFGLTFATLPGLIVVAVPAGEAGSATGLYQVIRAIGFSLGSAAVATVLAGYEAAGSIFPAERGYLVALWIGVAVSLGALFALLVLAPAARRGSPRAPLRASTPERV